MNYLSDNKLSSRASRFSIGFLALLICVGSASMGADTTPATPQTEADALWNAIMAKEFYTRFPNDPRADKAKDWEYEFMESAVVKNPNTMEDAFLPVAEAYLRNPKLTTEKRCDIRRSMLDLPSRKVGIILYREELHCVEGWEVENQLAERGARSLIAEFPGQEMPYEWLITVAWNYAKSDERRGITLLKEILTFQKAPASVRKKIREMIADMETTLELKETMKKGLGKPMTLQFTAIDGKEVDLAKLKGKVVLVDFWATWCGPCVKEMPKVKMIYEKYHVKGLEIIGISLDRDLKHLKEFVESQKIAWPQYFAAGGTDNAILKRYPAPSIPQLWLVDKNGNIQDLNGREDLEKKVESMLSK